MTAYDKTDMDNGSQQCLKINTLNLSQRVVHYCEQNLLKKLYACSTEETFLQYFLVILKQKLQNHSKILR